MNRITSFQIIGGNTPEHSFEFTISLEGGEPQRIEFVFIETNPAIPLVDLLCGRFDPAFITITTTVIAGSDRITITQRGERVEAFREDM